MGVGREGGFRETEQLGTLVSASTVWLLTSRGNLVERRTVSCIHSCEVACPLFLCDLLKRKTQSIEPAFPEEPFV